MVERLLYITLGLVFIGVGIGLYVAVNFGNKLDKQLQLATEQREAQQKTIDQVRENQNVLKATALKNTLYLECIINLHSRGIAPNEGNCRIESDATSPQSKSASSTNTQDAKDAKTTASPPPPPPPQPGPPPTTLERISNTIDSLRKAVGL